MVIIDQYSFSKTGTGFRSEKTMGMNDNLWKAPDSVNTVEQLQATSHLPEDQWLDLLEMTWKEYYSFRAGQSELGRKSLENLSSFFDLSLPQLVEGEIDFRNLSINKAPKDSHIPEQYLVGAHGRLRTTITSLEFLEKKYGWRLKSDVLKKFDLFESNLQDAFAPISIRLITEICDYLYKRQFTADDFYQMGVYSYEGNKHTLLSQIYSEIHSFKDAFQALFTHVMPLFEQNCAYHFEFLKDGNGLVTVQSNPDVAAALKVKALGSPHTCQLKGGIWASTALYFGLDLPKVSHLRCEHKGDGICEYLVDFSACKPRDKELTDSLQSPHTCN